MKNKFLTLALIAALISSLLAGCGSKETSTTPSTDSQPTTSVSADTTPADAPKAETTPSNSDASTSKFATIEEYCATPAMQAQLNATVKQVEAMGLGFDLVVEGNTMNYNYYYNEATSANFKSATQEQINQSFEPNLASQMDTFKSAGMDILNDSGVSEVTIVLNYFTNDKTLLYTTSIPVTK